jgi:hypothetical protein
MSDVLACALAGRWEVRIGLRGSKHVYLGLHSSEVEAARVYDRALVLLTGSSAATNFPVSNYTKELEAYQKCGLMPSFHHICSEAQQSCHIDTCIIYVVLEGGPCWRSSLESRCRLALIVGKVGEWFLGKDMKRS